MDNLRLPGNTPAPHEALIGPFISPGQKKKDFIDFIAARVIEVCGLSSLQIGRGFCHYCFRKYRRRRKKWIDVHFLNKPA